MTYNVPYIEVLKEIANIGTGHAASSLSILLNKRIEMNLPTVSQMSFSELTELLGSPETVVASVMLQVTGEFNGSMFYLLRVDEAEKMLRFLLPTNEVSLTSEHHTDMTYSALKEVANILTGSYLSALSDFTNLKIASSTPALSIDMFGAIISSGILEIAKTEDNVLSIGTHLFFKDGGSIEHVNGYCFLFPTADSMQQFQQVEVDTQ